MILGGINFGWNRKKGLKQTLQKGFLRPVGWFQG
jgi:hypothetical protein